MGLAEQVLDDDEDVVAVMLPDDIVLPMGVMEKMAQVRSELGGSVLCAFNVSRDEVSNYGVFDIEESDQPNVKRVRGMVEKPDVEDAPSTFVLRAATCLIVQFSTPSAVSPLVRVESCSSLMLLSYSLKKVTPCILWCTKVSDMI